MDSASVKQPNEEYQIEIDFAEVLDDESVSALDSAQCIKDSDDSDVSSSMLDSNKDSISGTKYYLWVQGGAAGATYTITLRITSDTTSSKFEYDFKLPVVEI